MLKNLEKLTLKQEKFCREYVLCMNASEAYRRAFPGSEKWKPASLWSKASDLLSNEKVRQRAEFLKKNAEDMLGINKTNQLNELIRIRNRCLKPEPKMVWQKNDKGKMEQIQEEDEEGNLVWQFDSAGANSAQDKILKAMGYYAPTSVVTEDKDGNIMPLKAVTINIQDNTIPNES